MVCGISYELVCPEEIRRAVVDYPSIENRNAVALSAFMMSSTRIPVIVDTLLAAYLTEVSGVPPELECHAVPSGSAETYSRAEVVVP